MPTGDRPGFFLLKSPISIHMIKDAYKFAVPPLVAGVVCLLFGWKIVAAVLIFLGGFIFYFFRDPERGIPPDPAAIVSPADGKVVDIVGEELDSRSGRRISIFLSIWNVHVQRAPAAGQITEVTYRPGRFYGAFRARASTENEQNVIHIDTPQGILVFKQIAGAIARRVLCWKRKGETVARGERVGLIRFGSRVDIWLPIEAEITVRRGQMVKGGESILAKWTSIA